jgi:cation transport ATPase
METDIATAQEQARDDEYRTLRRRLTVALALFVPIFLHRDVRAIVSRVAVSATRLAVPVVFYAGADFYRRAWLSLRHRHADMNTLIALGTGAAFRVFRLGHARQRRRRLLRGGDRNHRAGVARPHAGGTRAEPDVGRHSSG